MNFICYIYVMKYVDTQVVFEEIPDAAYCHLYLIRGDVENIEINETNIRLLAESHDVLDFVLVRNVE